MTSVVASGSFLLLRNPKPKPPVNHSFPNLCFKTTHVSISHHQSLNFGLRTAAHPSPTSKFFAAAAAAATTISTSTKSNDTLNDATTLLSGSTRTITTIFATAFALSKVFCHVIQSFAPKFLSIPASLDLAAIQALRTNAICTVGHLFFAARRARPSGYLNTPLTVVAAGMAKWLDIYSGVLMVRVLLSWFPNIPWDRQPLSAIRDLCDPYLNLFRNIIPPVFDTLDVSPLLAFAVLGTLGSILNNSRGSY
ncbi:ylmG homolog protein 1-2, chloroplastic-like [Aristolochia californica]|uniref:ylmG homolog protein 1-2, chloroplastic-like n=1 Tax=Aristolochia californica TaxID=171875 RepID=UPI0035DB3FD0